MGALAGGFDHEVELLQDLTSSRQKLEASLDQLGDPQFAQTRSSDPDNGGRGSPGYRGGGTLLYDAVYLASNELMEKQQGRKALIVLTDGVDRGSKETLQQAIATAQRADTLVYSILSPIRKATEAAMADRTWAEAESVVVEWEAVDLIAIPSSRVPTEKRYCSKCLRKHVASSLKSPRSSRLAISTTQ